MTAATQATRTHDAGPPPAAGAASPARARRATVAVTYLFVAVVLAATVPTPLYPFYASGLGLTPLLVTVVFAAYAVGTVVALLLFGSQSDRSGRRRVLLAGVAVSAVSSVTLLGVAGTGRTGAGLTLLLAGRVLSGLSVGLVSGAATAYLGELAADRHRAVTLATVANMGGLGLGSLLAGILAEHAPHPTVLPYVAAVVLLAPALSVVRAPETVPASSPRGLRLQRVALPPGNRRRFGSAAVAAFAAFAVLGLMTSLTSTFVAKGLHDRSHQLVGVLSFATFAAGTVGQLAERRLGTRTAMRAGLTALPLGLLAIVAALATSSLPGFAAGTTVAGASVGLILKAGLAVTAQLSPPERVAEVTSTFFLAAYAGLILPVIGAGLLVTTVGLLPGAIGLAVAVSLLVVVALRTAG